MSISIGQAFQDLQKTPQKWMTLMWLCICPLIPIVGGMVLLGYLFRRFARERELGEPTEDFNVDHFVDYLWGGLYPVLLVMVASLAFIPIMLIFIVVILGTSIAAGNSGNAAFPMIMLLMYLLMFPVIMVMYVFIMPLELRAGLRQNFGEGFSMSFMKSFIAKEGLSLAMSYFLLTLIAIPASFLGLCFFFVGVYVVSAVFRFLQVHILFQHYDRYLEKGGEPIPVSDELLYGKSVMETGGPPPQNPPGPPAL